jgi:RNA polymerase sigma-70 factor (ECF subfamily)
MATLAVDVRGNVQQDIPQDVKPSQDAERSLVREALGGSQEAFGTLFGRYQEKMFHVANRILRNREDAEDAVQQAFQHAFVHLKRFEGVSRFSTWLTRITINEALQLVRKRRPGHTSLEGRATEEGETHALEIADSRATPEEQSSEREVDGIVYQAIGELRPIFREVVQMYEMDEESSEKTAKALGLTNSTVKARAFRARRILRKKITGRLGLGKGAGALLFSRARNNFGGMRRAHALAL